MTLDAATKQIIIDACKEGRFDEAIKRLTDATSPNDLIVSANAFWDPGCAGKSTIDLDHAPDKLPGKPGSPNLYLRQRSNAPSGTETPVEIPTKQFKPRSIHLALLGCLVRPTKDGLPVLTMRCTPEGDVYITIVNAIITGTLEEAP